MKKIALLLMTLFFAAAVSGQEWKLDPVWSDDIGATYLSFASPAGDAAGEIFFTMWSYRTYDDASSTYFEVEYFRFSPRETHEFLKGVRDFAERNKREKAMAEICGIKVKTQDHPIAGSYTSIYSGPDFCMYKERKWAQIYDSFVGFCRDNNIEFE